MQMTREALFDGISRSKKAESHCELLLHSLVGTEV